MPRAHLAGACREMSCVKCCRGSCLHGPRTPWLSSARPACTACPAAEQSAASPTHGPCRVIKIIQHVCGAPCSSAVACLEGLDALSLQQYAELLKVQCEQLASLRCQAWALLEWHAGDCRAAARLFRAGAAAAPAHAPLLCAWARVEATRGRQPLARRLFRRALDADPAHAQSLLGLGAPPGPFALIALRCASLDHGRRC